LLSPPDDQDHFYMSKIAVGSKAVTAIDLNAPVATNISKVAAALGKQPEDLTVILLDRTRHQVLISEIRSTGARVRLITDGDVAAGIAPCIPETGVDLLMGIGGATEGVLAAAAVKILAGQLLARFVTREGRPIDTKIYSAEDFARGDAITFTATGVIDGPLLQGVRYEDHTIVTHSMVIRGQSKTVRYITTHHHI